MSINISSAIARVQVHALAAGAKEAPTHPTETNVQWPFSVCYPGNGSIVQGPGGGRKDLAVIFLDVHFNRVNLPLDVQAAETFYDAFGALLIADPKLNGTVATIRFDEGIEWEFGEMKWAKQETLGFRFKIPVKMED